MPKPKKYQDAKEPVEEPQSAGMLFVEALHGVFTIPVNPGLDAAVQEIVARIIPIPTFVTASNQAQLTQELAALLGGFKLPDNMAKYEALSAFVREHFPVQPEPTREPQVVRVEINSVPLTIAFKWPTPVPYSSDMVSVSRMEIQTPGMYYETTRQGMENQYEAYQRAVQEVASAFIRVAFEIHAEIVRQRGEGVVQLGDLTAQAQDRFYPDDDAI